MKKKILATIVFLLYIAVLLKITVFREGFSNNTFFNGSINFVFIKEYRADLNEESFKQQTTAIEKQTEASARERAGDRDRTEKAPVGDPEVQTE